MLSDWFTRSTLLWQEITHINAELSVRIYWFPDSTKERPQCPDSPFGLGPHNWLQNICPNEDVILQIAETDGLQEAGCHERAGTESRDPVNMAIFALNCSFLIFVLLSFYTTSSTGIKEETTLVKPTFAVCATWRVKWVPNKCSRHLRIE